MTPGGDIVQQVDIDNPLLPTQGGSYRCVVWVQEIKDYVYSQPVNIDNGELLLWIFWRVCFGVFLKSLVTVETNDAVFDPSNI